MKNAENKNKKVTAKNFRITEFKFYWEFEGNGNYREKLRKQIKLKLLKQKN
jgi:hypothetical protein